MSNASAAEIVKGQPYTARGVPLAPFEAKPLWWILKNAADNFPDRTALIFNDYSCSYREFWELAQRVAKGLQAVGIKPGDKVSPQPVVLKTSKGEAGPPQAPEDGLRPRNGQGVNIATPQAGAPR